jgi:hypothetical protein
MNLEFGSSTAPLQANRRRTTLVVASRHDHDRANQNVRAQFISDIGP